MRTVLKCRHEPESNQGSGTPGGRLTGQRVCPAACAHMRCMLHMHGLLHMAWQPAGALPNQICDSGATCAAYACQCWVVWQHFQGCHREIRPEFSGFVTYDRTRRPNTGACTASFRVCALNSETISESLPVAVACSLCAWLTTWAHILRTCAPPAQNACTT